MRLSRHHAVATVHGAPANLTDHTELATECYRPVLKAGVELAPGMRNDSEVSQPASLKAVHGRELGYWPAGRILNAFQQDILKRLEDALSSL